jgi:hypothetical protein
MQDRHRDERTFDRRVFLRSGILLGGAAVAGGGLLRGAEAEKKGEQKEPGVGPPEDLMREHGVLKARSFNLRRNVASHRRETGFST